MAGTKEDETVEESVYQKKRKVRTFSYNNNIRPAVYCMFSTSYLPLQWIQYCFEHDCNIVFALSKSIRIALSQPN